MWKSCGYVQDVHINIETGKTYTFEIGSDCARNTRLYQRKKKKKSVKS